MRHVAFSGAGRVTHASAALTDLDVQLLIRPVTWIPATTQVLIGEWNTAGNNRGWEIRQTLTDQVALRWSADGTSTLTDTSTVATGLDHGTKRWLRVTLDVNNGAGGHSTRFYLSDDGVEWTQLGATVTTAGATSIFHNAATPITLGGETDAASYIGKAYEVRVYAAIDGSTNLVDPDPWDWSTAVHGTSGVTFVMPSLAVAEQDVWPPRVLVTATDLEADDLVTLYRSVAGARTGVRGADAVIPGDTALVRLDAELPFGVPITYVMDLGGEEEYSASPVTVDLPGGKVAISDAITGLSAEVEITDWPEKRHERPASRFVVGGRNMVVFGQRPGWTGTIEIETTSDAGRENFDQLLDTATEGVVQIRQAGAYGGVDCYVAVLSDTEKRRNLTDGLDERRMWALDLVEVEPWAADVEAAGYTYADLADVYDGLDYADLDGDYSSYLLLAQADLEA